MATATSSRTRSNNRVLSAANCFQRSVSPSGRFYSSGSSSSSGFASSTAAFSSQSTQFLHRSSSPTRVSLSGPISSSPSIRFSIDRASSPNRSLSVSSHDQVLKKKNNGFSSSSSASSSSSSSSSSSAAKTSQKRTCLCSPTTHPGSFRCSLHKGIGFGNQSLACSSNRLNARRSAMTNSLVRIGTVEGEWVKRALTALIRPSSHQQRRREGFQPRPSRLSVMSRAEEV